MKFIIKTIDPRQNSTLYEYNGTHNLINLTDALEKITWYQYNTNFRKTDEYDPLDHRIHYDYDSEHHLTGTIVYPEEGKQIETNTAYYANGLPHTDGRGTITTMTHDGYGNPDTSQTGSQPAVDSDYDPIGRIKSLTDQASSITTFDYDARSLLLTRTDPLLKTVTLAYYDDGKVHTITDRNEDLIEYTYTPSGNPETVRYTENGATEPSLQVSYGYDIRDNLRSMQDSLGTTQYDYDTANRLTSVTDPHGFVTGYGYDEAGNLTTLTYPGGKTVSYTYDALNRLETVANWLGETALYQYDAAGRLTGMQNFNGTLTTYEYDDANRLTGLSVTRPDSSIIASYSFTLDENGNRTGVSEQVPLTAAPPAAATNYTYNPPKKPSAKCRSGLFFL